MRRGAGERVRGVRTGNVGIKTEKGKKDGEKKLCATINHHPGFKFIWRHFSFRRPEIYDNNGGKKSNNVCAGATMVETRVGE